MDQSNTLIDHSHLEDVSGGDREFEAELMQEFVGSTPRLISDLAQAIVVGDVKRVEISSHTIKGSCRSLGAVLMADPCFQIEKAAREGSLENAPELLQQVQQQFDALCHYIERTWNVKAA
ncbi:MAG: Hpt domain-containing protein [Candidatus Eisenbacteria bacterium]|uniref:Hpt domain-containing protein n=1 Tax=Eiseniibacteriota bacterium TaxID=2212470 RepID=A0A956RR62_UNCEI|nr:Hpt domain-containing protein [Candidatus Eisenbacteria bacterium]